MTIYSVTYYRFEQYSLVAVHGFGSKDLDEDRHSRINCRCLIKKNVASFDMKPICSFQVNLRVILKVLQVEFAVFRVLINSRW